ncbi:MAG: chaperonin GroEL [Victivallaceae bacterium]
MNMPKHLIFGREAGEKLAAGILKLADAVAPTLGPKGCNVGLQTWNSSKITNDGFTIVKDFVLSDQYENMGAEMAREVASKIKEMSGDGTTTGIILLSSIVNEGLKNLSSGMPVRKINEGIRLAVEAINEKIINSSTQIKDNSQIKSIAMAAASGNESIASVIAEAFEKIGQTGFVSVEAGSTMETTVEIVNGLEIKKGYAGAYFITDTEKMLVVMNSPYVLITDKKISSAQEILPILQSFASTGKELVIFCDDMDNDVLSTLVVNKLKGILKVAVVKAPGFGDQKMDNLEDIAIFTGSNLISENTGILLKNVTLDSLGRCDRIEISSSTTKLIGSHCLKDVLSMRLRQFEVAIEEHPENKQQFLLRKTRLEGKVAVIKVGASTEIELQQKKQVFEDSVNATRLAIESGFVVGGGLSLFKAALALQDLVSQQKDHAVAVGIRSVIKACEAPLRRIIRNSGLEDSVILNKINHAADEDIGFNMNSGHLENLKESGVLDPTLVITNILTHASSMAQVILMSEVLIGDDKDDD